MIDNPILTLDCQSQSNPPNWIAIQIEQSRNPIQQFPEVDNIVLKLVGAFCSLFYKSDFIHFIFAFRIPISSTFNTPDPKCRFIAVKSDCDESAAICGGHTAFVTALESRCIYMVDLVSGISKVVSLVNNVNLY